MEVHQQLHEDTLHRLHREHVERQRRFYRMEAKPRRRFHPAVPEPEPVEEKPVRDWLFPRPGWDLKLEEISFEGNASGRTLLRLLSHHLEITLGELRSIRRTADVVRKRQICCFVLYHVKHYSLPQIGRMLGNRDHTTALHAIRKIERLCQTDECLRRQVAELACICRQAKEPLFFSPKRNVGS